MAILLLALGAAPLFADVELKTSINDVFNRGSAELAGSITMTVNDDDFSEASTSEPIYIRVTPDHGSFLAETLVNQTDGVDLDHEFQSDPIFLAMKLNAVGGAFRLAALPETVSIVRWVAGESAFWICVQSSSDNWIVLQDGSPVLGGSLPNENAKVSWTLGVSARSSEAGNRAGFANGLTNLPFNTRDPFTVGNAGDPEDATSTLLCVNLESSSLDTQGIESLLRYDIISYDFRADIGDGFYSGNAGNPTTIDFTNDFNIARGKSRSCSVEFPDKQGPASERLCVPAIVGNGSLDGFVKMTNVVCFTIACASGGNLLDTGLFNGSYVNFNTGSRGAYGFLSSSIDADGTVNTNDAAFGSINSDGVFEADDLSGVAELDDEFTTNGFDLYSDLTIAWNAGYRALDSYDICIQVSTWYYFSDPAIQVDLDWEIWLVSHDGQRDTGVNDAGDMLFNGDDQFRRCAPSEFNIYEGIWDFGIYGPCTGDPAVLFFPYLPRLQGDPDPSFYVGLSYVNQGFQDFAEDGIEAIFYDENGNRFSTTMPGLDVQNQMTWLMMEDALGTIGLDGVGSNNDDEFRVPAPNNPNVPADSFGDTRMSMFVVGSFDAEFSDEVDNGDLDGYMLIGSIINQSVDGAYLPRNNAGVSNGNGDGDLPLRRSKATRNSGRNLDITSTREARFPFNGSKLSRK